MDSRRRIFVFLQVTVMTVRNIYSVVNFQTAKLSFLSTAETDLAQLLLKEMDVYYLKENAFKFKIYFAFTSLHIMQVGVKLEQKQTKTKCYVQLT